MEAVATGTKDIAPQSPKLNADEIEIAKDKKDVGGILKCCYCHLEERYDYKGSKSLFAKHLSFTEDCYIMKDPFNPSNRGEILVLGADCSICEKSVCTECSLFYINRFCKGCALKNIQHFPQKLKLKITQLNQEHNEEGM